MAGAIQGEEPLENGREASAPTDLRRPEFAIASALPRTDHPSWERISQELQCAPPFVEHVVMLSTDRFGRPIGRGWLLRCIIRPADDALFAGRTYPLELTVPASYPTDPPRVRWACIMDHPQISETGEMGPPDVVKHVLDWDDSKTILQLLYMCRDILSHPLPVEEEPWTDREIISFWAHHRDDCTCPLGAWLRMPMTEFRLLNEAGRQKELAHFRLGLARRPEIIFVNMAAQFREVRGSLSCEQ